MPRLWDERLRLSRHLGVLLQLPAPDRSRVVTAPRADGREAGIAALALLMEYGDRLDGLSIRGDYVYRNQAAATIEAAIQNPDLAHKVRDAIPAEQENTDEAASTQPPYPDTGNHGRSATDDGGD